MRVQWQKWPLSWQLPRGWWIFLLINLLLLLFLFSPLLIPRTFPLEPQVYLDLSKIELNDEASRLATKLKDEIQLQQKYLKEDIKRRKELETNIQNLFEKFQGSNLSFSISEFCSLDPISNYFDFFLFSCFRSQT